MSRLIRNTDSLQERAQFVHSDRASQVMNPWLDFKSLEDSSTRPVNGAAAWRMAAARSLPSVLWGKRVLVASENGRRSAVNNRRSPDCRESS